MRPTLRGLAWLCLLVAPLWVAAQTALTLELLSPAAPARTTREFVNVLGRSAPGAQVSVGGEPVTVYATGVFARDRIPLVPGVNRIRVEAAAGGQTLSRVLEVERTAPPPAPVWPTDKLFIDSTSLRPAESLRVVPGEAVDVAVHATPGQRVEARLPGQRWQPLAEAAAGRYRARLAFAGSHDVDAAPVQLRVTALSLPRGGARTLLGQTVAEVGQWRLDADRLYAAGPDGADLLHGLHEVRLGGPFLAELPPGTLLAVTGRRGDFLRVALAADTTAWVAASSVAPAPAGTRLPSAVFTTLSVAGSAEGDVVTVPISDRAPAAVRAAGRPGAPELEIDIWGGHDAATWISQRASAKLVRELTVTQPADGHVRVHVALRGPRLWGWRVERTAGALRLTVRPPPVLAATGSPLAGLRVALEPGHGGPDNLGSVGATAVPEKDVNRWAAEALRRELEAVGAQVVVVREGDDNPNLRERARRTTESQAQLFVSLHANATDTSAGFLRTAGVATFYKHAPGHDLAAAVHQRLLEQTGLDDFGLVGGFNYAPIRLVTWMPAVLVEQAFMTHPGDEARLLDPAFRALMARAIRLGLEDFLRLP
jgi:N-acetylmuramoyl-L-alanine amidase